MGSDPPSDPARDLDFESVDFEVWAKLSAQLLRRPVLERARLIHDAQLEKNWKGLDAHWGQALLEDIEAGRLERPDRYQALCHLELQGRQQRSAPPKPVSDTPQAEPELAELRQTIDSMAGASITEDVKAASEALGWPLDKYAWLCAELQHAPERAEHVWALHGLSSERAQQAVREGWQERLDGDPEVAVEHGRLLKQYLGVLRG